MFVRSGGVWSFQQKLTPNDGATGDGFGRSVAIDADTVTISSFSGNGATYVFVRSGGVWSKQKKLTAAEGAANDYFGGSVAIFGGNVNQGALYSFGCGYVERQRLAGAGGADRDYFGNAVAIDGDTAVVGSPAYDAGTSSQGSAFVLTRNGAAWTQTARLIAPLGKNGYARSLCHRINDE